MQRVPLQAEEPPRNLPLLRLIWRLLIPLPGVDTIFQSVALPKFSCQLQNDGELACQREKAQEDFFLPADHVDILYTLAVRASFEDQNGDIVIFCKSAGHDTARSSTSERSLAASRL